jgi:signal transduction histidine kinase
VPEISAELVAWLAAGGVAIAVLAASAVHAAFTRRLGRLRSALETFERTSDPTALRLAAAEASGDALAQLAIRIEAMSDRVLAQTAALATKEREQRDLLANVSHDLRTPLASIQGYLELLLLRQGSLDDTEARNYLETAARQSERLGRLVADLFELTRLEADGAHAESEDFPLGELAHDVTQKFAADAARRGVRLEARVAAAPPAPPLFVRADIGLVERVLDNLVENALRHTPAGGSVTLDAAPCEGRARLVVSDTGEGIPAAALPGIFDRYYRTERTGSGQRASGHGGLGLMIARRIVDLHQGTLRIDSSERLGTKISFDLPLAEAQGGKPCSSP